MKKLLVILLAAWLGLTVFGGQAGAAGKSWDWGDGVRVHTLHAPYGPHQSRIDTDKKVPVVRYCNALSTRLAYTYIDREIEDGKLVVRASIHINKCRLDAEHASYERRIHVLRHEKAHAKGWMHLEANPQINPAFFPKS